METIAICITTHNRYNIFKRSYDAWNKLKPIGADIFVVDDGSRIPVLEANYRFDTNQGIAVAKNACLALAKGYDHIFLVDDDIYPIKDGWEVAYTHSGYNHLQLSFQFNSRGTRLSHSVEVVDNIDGYDIYAEPNGVLYYFTNKAIDSVGGYDERFKQWSGEHSNISRRIYNNGLTPYPFMTPAGSIDDFYIHDYYGNIQSSVPNEVRVKHAKINIPLAEQLKDDKSKFPIPILY